MVVDLTAHDPGKHVSFFADADCHKLINVALSRAKDLLLVVGSRAAPSRTIRAAVRGPGEVTVRFEGTPELRVRFEA